MVGLSDLRPGDIGFGPIGGAAGVLVWFGQKIVDAATRQESRYKHAFVVTKTMPATAVRPFVSAGARIVQAMPSGAEEIEIGAEHWTPDYLYIRPAYEHLGPGRPVWVRTEPTQALAVAQAAKKYVGTPYSFLDYAAIAGLHLGVKGGPIRRYVTTSKHMICSQLADQAMSDGGWHVFDDGRLPQDVTPVALYRRMMTMPGQFIVPGGDWRQTR